MLIMQKTRLERTFLTTKGLALSVLTFVVIDKHKSAKVATLQLCKWMILVVNDTTSQSCSNSLLKNVPLSQSINVMKHL